MCHTLALFLLNVFIILVPTGLPCTGRGGDFVAEFGWPVMAERLQSVKGYFSRSKDTGNSECSKVWQHEGNLYLDSKPPIRCHHCWRIYSRNVGFLLKNDNLVSCNSGLLNRSLKTFRTVEQLTRCSPEQQLPAAHNLRCLAQLPRRGTVFQNTVWKFSVAKLLFLILCVSMWVLKWDTSQPGARGGSEGSFCSLCELSGMLVIVCL